MRAASFLLAAMLPLSPLSTLACSSNEPTTIGAEHGAGGAAAGTGGAAVGSGGAGPAASGGTTGGVGGGVGTGAGGAPVVTPGVDETLCGNVQLAATKTVPAGMTVAICAGSTVTASATNVSLTVQGKLLVQGTAQNPVKLVGAQGGTADWGGLIIDAGGTVSATYVEIRNASIALAARPGSAFDIDHMVIDTSEEMMILSSSGSIGHGTLRGLGDNQAATPVLISNASPRITNTSITQALYGGVDMVVVGGPSAAPLFDHVEVADSHCAFHFDSSNGAVISNSYVHHNTYAFMVIGSVGGHVVHNNFQDNSVNLGACSGASMEVKDNYFVGDPFDSTCSGLTVTGVTPPGPYLTGVGPTP